jgi:hypothetical protein
MTTASPAPALPRLDGPDGWWFRDRDIHRAGGAFDPARDTEPGIDQLRLQLGELVSHRVAALCQVPAANDLPA